MAPQPARKPEAAVPDPGQASWQLVIERAAQRVFGMPEFYAAFGEASERIRSDVVLRDPRSGSV